LALLSDPHGQDPKSWEYAVESRNGADTYQFDANSSTYVAGIGDGIREFVVTLGGSGDQAAANNAALVHLGSNDVSELAAHVTNGYTAVDLADFNGKLVLPDDGPATLPGQNSLSIDDAGGATALYQSLEALRQSAKIRMWPLYTQASSETVSVSGLVAARVVAVTPPSADQPMQITLKPTMIHRSDILTDTDIRGSAATMNHNAYICKIRRVE
jgi:hypothetical protein